MVNDSCLRGHHSFFLRMEGDIPFVTANHPSLEHKQGKQCQVQTERTKYPGGRKIAPKETWLTYENNYSYTDKQQSPDAERNTSDSNWLLPSENRTRRKHYSTHSALLFSALFATRKHGFPPTRFLHSSQNMLHVKKSIEEYVFVKCSHCSRFCLFSQFTSKNVHVIQTFDFYFRTLLLLLLLHVSTCVWLDFMETVILCVFLYYFLAWLS